MIDVTIQVPTKVQITTLSFTVPINPYLHLEFRTAGDVVLHAVSEQAPAALFGPLLKEPGAISFDIDLQSWTILDWSPPSREQLAAIAPAAAGALRVTLQAKVRDQFSFCLKTASGHPALMQEDYYVPSFMPGSDEDYIDLVINLADGRILNVDLNRTERNIHKVFALAADHSSLRITPP